STQAPHETALPMVDGKTPTLTCQGNVAVSERCRPATLSLSMCWARECGCSALQQDEVRPGFRPVASRQPALSAQLEDRLAQRRRLGAMLAIVLQRLVRNERGDVVADLPVRDQQVV